MTKEGGELHDHRDPRPADDSRGVRRQGELGHRSQPPPERRSGGVPRQDRGRLRLRAGLEPFHAGDGTLYLLESGYRARLAIRDAPSWLPDACAALQTDPCYEQELHRRLKSDGHQLRSADLGRAVDDLVGAGVVTRLPVEWVPASGRFARQALHLSQALGGDDLAADAQRRLGEATVVVLGCGGLGCWALAGLACIGVGHLVLVDDDVVEESNLNRQVLFRAADVGEAKVTAAARFLRAFDPDLEVTPLRRRIRTADDVAELASAADMLVETADWPPHLLSRWVNEACAGTGTPHISAAQWPPTVRIGPLVVPGQSPCWECLEIGARRQYPLYDEVVQAQAARPTPVATTGPLSGVVGSLLAQEVFACVTGTNRPATLGRAVTIDCATLDVSTQVVEPDDSCAACAASRRAAEVDGTAVLAPAQRRHRANPSEERPSRAAGESEPVDEGGAGRRS